MEKYFCNGKKDFCDNIENLSECQFADGSGVISGEKVEYIFSSVFGGDYDLSRLRELVQADREGRCVVLQCKRYDTLWTFCDYPKNKVYSFKVTDVSTLNGRTMLNTDVLSVVDARDIGKTVFLTREAAEAALKEREKDES